MAVSCLDSYRVLVAVVAPRSKAWILVEPAHVPANATTLILKCDQARDIVIGNILTVVYIDGNLCFMEHLTQTFAALADPTRLGIVVHLARSEATVSELVDRFDLTQPTITSHLKVLESVGLITRTRIGQSRPAQLAFDRFDEITKWIAQVQHVWESNYQRLDAVLAEMKHAEEKTKRKRKK